MKAIAHPLFETLYVDPEEGLLWDGELPNEVGKVKVILCIPHAVLVTKRVIEFAASCAADINGLDTIARRALCTTLTQQPHGPCHRYWNRFLQPLAMTKQVAEPPLAQADPSCSLFLSQIQLSLVGLYPVQTDSPIMLEYTACYNLFPAALRVTMNALAQPLEVTLERENP